MTTIRNKLDHLVQVIEEWGYPLSNYLNPPLTREEVDIQTQHLPYRLPEELYELYQWHDGVDDPDFRLSLFRDRKFLSLQDAVDEYETVVRCRGDDEFLVTCFPFGSFMGSWYVLSASTQPLKPALEHPVIDIYHSVNVAFLSFSVMLDTITAWYAEGAYRADPEEEIVPDINESLEKEIWRRLNPGIFDSWYY